MQNVHVEMWMLSSGRGSTCVNALASSRACSCSKHSCSSSQGTFVFVVMWGRGGARGKLRSSVWRNERRRVCACMVGRFSQSFGGKISASGLEMRSMLRLWSSLLPFWYVMQNTDSSHCWGEIAKFYFQVNLDFASWYTNCLCGFPQNHDADSRTTSGTGGMSYLPYNTCCSSIYLNLGPRIFEFKAEKKTTKL